VKFGLETTRALLAHLDHPEAAAPSLLVAGTNGKGSVVAYLDAALRGAGLRVGRYTSPHLVSVRERIVVAGRPIAASAFEAAVGRVRRAADALVARGVIPAHPTHFEVLTVAAFEHFRRAAVDIAVLEVGMGGRLDATNTAEPLASAIVSIDRDHEAFLGNTLAAIAFEKAGVLRASRSTVVGPLPAEAREAIASRAVEVGARLVEAWDGASASEDAAGAWSVRTPSRTYGGLRPLLGAHQRDNLVVALRLLEEAAAAGLDLDWSGVAAGLAAVRWPGRLEWVKGRPPLLLDGAHNPAGARALAAYARGIGPFVLLFGVMADKAMGELAQILFPLAAEVVLTRPAIARAAAPDEIARAAGTLAARAHAEASVRRALTLARRLAGPARPVVVAGSLYLVGEVKSLLRGASAAGV
jgi:dihydrofolate synthase/folylpolyglutamate synthase